MLIKHEWHYIGCLHTRNPKLNSKFASVNLFGLLGCLRGFRCFSLNENSAEPGKKEKDEKEIIYRRKVGCFVFFLFLILPKTDYQPSHGLNF